MRDKSRLGDLALIVAAVSLLMIALEPRRPLGRVAVPSDAGVRFVRDFLPRADRAGRGRRGLDVDRLRRKSQSCDQGEYYAILLASTFAMFLMAESANLLMAYLSLEFVSLTSYILTGFLRHNRRSQEAALKYLIYGGVASGTMIYGMSWIFGIAGSLDFSRDQQGALRARSRSRCSRCSSRWC